MITLRKASLDQIVAELRKRKDLLFGMVTVDVHQDGGMRTSCSPALDALDAARLLMMGAQESLRETASGAAEDAGQAGSH